MTRTTRSLLGSLCILILVAVAAVARPAAAQPAPAAAAPTAQDQANYKRHFDTAKKLVLSQAFDVAAGEFEAAYSAVPNPDALRQALDCYKQMHAAAKQRATAKRLLDKPKTLKPGEKKTLDALVASLAGSVGTVAITSSEAGAAVQLDGQDIGLTPLPQPVEVDIGTHHVNVKKQGFEPFDQDVGVAAQVAATVTAKLEPEITAGKVTVSEKSGATMDVVVDGKVVGPTPWSGDLPLGTHQISGQSPTMQAPAQSVEVVKRQPLTVTLVGSATTGSLDVETVAGKGVIYVDDKVAGEGKATVDLPVGKHHVEIKREGYITATRDVDIQAGATMTLRLALEPAAPAVPPGHSYDTYEGIYGGMSFAGLIQANQTGNQVERRCSDIGPSCSPDTVKGGGLYGYVGYTWRPVGVDFFFGGSGDTSHPTAANPSGGSAYGWDVSRIGGLGAIRVRSMLSTHVVRAALALGGGVAERVVMIGGGSSTDYTSIVGTADLSFGLRSSSTATVVLGCMMFLEDAGQGAVVNVSASRTPFYLYSGSQVLIEPYLGIQFGP